MERLRKHYLTLPAMTGAARDSLRAGWRAAVAGVLAAAKRA